jgi:hypothetical protein
MGETASRSADGKSEGRSRRGSVEAPRPLGRRTGGDGRPDAEEPGGRKSGGRREDADPVEDGANEASGSLDVDTAALLTARKVWNNIGAEFNKLRESKGKAIAWKTFQKRLNEHGGILCEIMSAKDLVELSMKIEDNMKDEGGEEDESGLDYARKFLEGKRVN